MSKSMTRAGSRGRAIAAITPARTAGGEPVLPWAQEVSRLYALAELVEPEPSEPMKEEEERHLVPLKAAWQLEDKVRSIQAQTLVGLLAKLRLLAEELRRDHLDAPLSIKTAYCWDATYATAFHSMVASAWADAERLIGKGGDA